MTTATKVTTQFKYLKGKYNGIKKKKSIKDGSYVMIRYK